MFYTFILLTVLLHIFSKAPMAQEQHTLMSAVCVCVFIPFIYLCQEASANRKLPTHYVTNVITSMVGSK